MKKDKRFNVIDLLICVVLFIIIIMSAVFLSDNVKDSIFTDSVTYRTGITVRTEILTNDYSDKFTVGQTVIDFDTGDELGTISDIQLIHSEGDNGDEFRHFYAVIEIASLAEFRGDHFLLGDKRLLKNKIKRFSVPELYFEGDITSIHAYGYEY